MARVKDSTATTTAITAAEETPKRTRNRRPRAAGPLGVRDKLKMAQRLVAAVDGMGAEEQRTLLAMVCTARPELAAAMRRALTVLREIPGEADRRAVVACANSVLAQEPVAQVNGAGDVQVEA